MLTLLLHFSACNGTVIDDDEMGQVIQLQGDQRTVAKKFLESKDGLNLSSNTIKVGSLK
jgi:translation initiation factor 1